MLTMSPGSRSTRRAPPTTRAPSAASARTVAAPIPLEAPVTIAVLHVSAPTAPDVTARALLGQQRHRACLPLAAVVGELRRDGVLLALGRLEAELVGDRGGLRELHPRLHHVDDLLLVVDAVRRAERRAGPVVVRDERDVDHGRRVLV